jgi:hypothetical protein
MSLRSVCFWVCMVGVVVFFVYPQFMADPVPLRPGWTILVPITLIYIGIFIKKGGKKTN